MSRSRWTEEDPKFAGLHRGIPDGAILCGIFSDKALPPQCCSGLVPANISDTGMFWPPSHSRFDSLPHFQNTPMTKNVIAAVVGSVCAMFLWEARSFGLEGSNLIITGTASVSGSTTLGSLVVSGTADVRGNGLYFGSWTSDPGMHGVEFTYTDATSEPMPSLLKLTATRPSHEWLWEHYSEDQTSTLPMMKLDASHVLTIFDTAGNAAIVLNPAGSSDGTTVLTQQAADGRYVSSASLHVGSVSNEWGYEGSTFSLPGGNATGFDSFAGIGATANGPRSIAIGNQSTASANGAIATGHCSNAVGGDSNASGPFSTAIGLFSTASGYWSAAGGDYSTAAGPYTIAAGYGQFVVGRYNNPQGDSCNWVPTDELFTVGNGYEVQDENGWSYVPSNAFVVKKNGDTAVNGNFTVSGVIRVAPQGDLDMGAFAYEPPAAEPQSMQVLASRQTLQKTSSVANAGGSESAIENARARVIALANELGVALPASLTAGSQSTSVFTSGTALTR